MTLTSTTARRTPAELPKSGLNSTFGKVAAASGRCLQPRSWKPEGVPVAAGRKEAGGLGTGAAAFAAMATRVLYLIPFRENEARAW